MGGAWVVTSDHGDLKTQRLERLDRAHRVGLDGVGDSDHSGRRSVDRHVHRRFALVSQSLSLGLQCAECDGAVVHQLAIPDEDSSSADRCLHAVPGDRFESVGIGDGDSPLRRALHDRLSEWML